MKKENLNRPVIYQLLPRLFSNTNRNNKKYGTLAENGSGKLNHITKHVLHQIRKQGISHIWFTGLIEHASCTAYPQHHIESDNPQVVKGIAGSPYAIRDYYDIDPDLAENIPSRMAEFDSLVKRCHEMKLGVIMDFVPNHVARSYHSDSKPGGVDDLGEKDDKEKAFSPTNNFYYLPGEELVLPEQLKQLPYVTASGREPYHEFPAKATGNDRFTARPDITDWYETVKLNYGIDYLNHGKKHFDPIPDTWFKMRDILLFWASRDIDGFRCDMAEMVPVEFWNWVIPRVKEKFPEIIFIAEIYNPEAYRLYIEEGRFDFLYDKVGLYDTLRMVMAGNVPARHITHEWQKLDGLDPYMLRFLENHDEQRITSQQFAGSARAGWPAMAVSALMNKGSVMIYSGQESAELGSGETGFSSDDSRTSIFDYCHMPMHLNWVNNGKYDGGGFNEDQKMNFRFYTRLLNLCHHEVFRKGSFYDLMWFNEDGEFFNGNYTYTFVRYYKGQTFLVVANFNAEDSVKLKIKFPPDLLKLMGQEGNQLISGKDILSGQKKQIRDVDKFSETGITVVIERSSACVFHLKFKMKN
ncbi:MAG: alpha-amylase family protein [Bacteroidales bacterium]|nr:alpha-amylase family protein [Bacteroidales bacterium]